MARTYARLSAHAHLARTVGAVVVLAAAVLIGASLANADTIYSQTLTLPVPPASNFQGRAEATAGRWRCPRRRSSTSFTTALSSPSPATSRATPRRAAPPETIKDGSQE